MLHAVTDYTQRQRTHLPFTLQYTPNRWSVAYMFSQFLLGEHVGIEIWP